MVPLAAVATCGDFLSYDMGTKYLPQTMGTKYLPQTINWNTSNIKCGTAHTGYYWARNGRY